MATPKQTRRILRKIYYHTRHLQAALNEAHSREVIDYPNEEESYKKHAPCWAMDQLRDRIDKTTKDARAKVITDEIKATIKNVY